MATIKTILLATAEQLRRLARVKGLRANSDRIDLIPDAKYAVCILRLHDDVVTGNYPTLATAVKDIAGIQDIDLLVDYQAASVAELEEYEVEVASMRVDVKLRDDTPE